jgi:hypothetical protein
MGVALRITINKGLRLLTAVAAVAGFSTLVGAAPAQAAPGLGDLNCRETYFDGGWDAGPCIRYHAGLMQGQAFMFDSPSNCAGFRVYLLDEHKRELRSTSMRPCNEGWSTVVEESRSYFPDGKARARLKAFDSSGRVILLLDGPQIDI